MWLDISGFFSQNNASPAYLDDSSQRISLQGRILFRDYLKVQRQILRLPKKASVVISVAVNWARELRACVHFGLRESTPWGGKKKNCSHRTFAAKYTHPFSGILLPSPLLRK
jgi:hypothetical protein